MFIVFVIFIDGIIFAPMLWSPFSCAREARAAFGGLRPSAARASRAKEKGDHNMGAHYLVVGTYFFDLLWCLHIDLSTTTQTTNLTHSKALVLAIQ